MNAAAKALEFYAEVFQAKERSRIPGPEGTIVHAEIEIGDSVLIVEDAAPYMGTKAPPAGGLDGTPLFLFIYVADVDAVIECAVQWGATLKRPAQDSSTATATASSLTPSGTAGQLPAISRTLARKR